MKYIYSIILASLLVMFTSCSNDYRKAIPSGCTALVGIDVTKDGVGEQLQPLQNLLHISDATKCGIDFSQKLYLFETSDGNFGLCSKVSDADELKSLIDQQEKDGFAKYISERQDCRFASIGGKSIIGWNSSAMLLMGPVIPGAQGDMINYIACLLKQNEDESIVGSPMMERIENSKHGISLIAQATAFPDKLSSIITFGIPQNIEPSECLIAADITISDGMIHIQAEPTSFNTDVEKQVTTIYSIFQPIGERFVPSIDNRCIGAFLCNVNGQKLLPMLQKSEGMLPLLAGVNQAIDLNAVINSIEGNVIFTAPAYSKNGVHATIAAELSSDIFLKDIAYWKSSVPQGSIITDWKQNAYCYTDGTLSYYFGVSKSPKLEFYSGTTSEYAENSLRSVARPLDDKIQKAIVGQRLAVILNISSLIPDNAGMVKLMLPRILKMNHIVYTVK